MQRNNTQDMLTNGSATAKEMKLIQANQESLKLLISFLSYLGLSAQRAQTLHILDIHYMYKDKDKVVFYLHELTKTSRPSYHPEPLKFLPFPQDEQMCVLQALNAYLDRTKSTRGNCTKLFISGKAPHKPVPTCTISKWIKSSLAAAGIDITVFSTHSTRSTSSSFAKSKGLTVSAIAKAAGWSNATTFARYYSKDICSLPTFGQCIQENSCYTFFMLSLSFVYNLVAICEFFPHITCCQSHSRL